MSLPLTLRLDRERLKYIAKENNMLIGDMTPEQRIEFIKDLTEGYCIKCGNEIKEGCTCDEK